VATGVADMFTNIYLVKNYKISKTSTSTKAIEKHKHRFGILEILENFGCMFSLI
jgi:hypothetical protein